MCVLFVVASGSFNRWELEKVTSEETVSVCVERESRRGQVGKREKKREEKRGEKREEKRDERGMVSAKQQGKQKNHKTKRRK